MIFQKQYNNLELQFQKMAHEVAMQYNLILRFLKCALPEDTIDVDLKFHTLKGIHIFKKDYKSHTSRCSPWEAGVKPYPALRKKDDRIHA